MYKGLEEDVTVFGVGATFVSSTNTDDEVVYQAVKAVFENLDRFRRLHLAFANLKKEDMITKNISAPLHDGAASYYKEAGLIRGRPGRDNGRRCRRHRPGFRLAKRGKGE